MRIVYLLEGTALFGGTKVALLQAEVLHRIGHQVSVVSREPPPSWISLGVDFHYDPALDPARLPEADLVVATFWTTIPTALAAPSGYAVHLCQGLEYTYTHNHDQHPQILEAYRAPLPALCVAPHLVEEVEGRFGRPARVVRQPLEPFMQPAPLELSGRSRLRTTPPRIAIVGPWEIDWKGVSTALAAARRLRASGVECQVVRLSQWPATPAEVELLDADERHQHIHPSAVAELLAGCDLLLAGSWHQEGFGLPVLEAMACGVPVVATEIAPYRWFAGDAARLVPPDDSEAMATAARDLLCNEDAWLRARERGLAAAREFAPDRVAADVASGFEWAYQTAMGCARSRSGSCDR